MGESCGIVHELTNKPSLLMLQHNYRSVLFVLVGGIRCGNCLRDLSRAKRDRGRNRLNCLFLVRG